MEQRSKISIAYDVLKDSNKPMVFLELWNKIVEIKGLSNKESASSISSFYTELTMDGRFINVGNNTWVLREKLKYSEVAASLSDIEDEDANDESELEDEDEEKLEKDDNEDEDSEESEENY